MENINELKERASKSFDSKFRDDLCNGVQKHILVGGKIKPNDYGLSNDEANCRCPEGCLGLGLLKRYPSAEAVFNYVGFSYKQHTSFQQAFDDGNDDDTPEAALGLLYRERFYDERY